MFPLNRRDIVSSFLVRYIRQEMKTLLEQRRTHVHTQQQRCLCRGGHRLLICEETSIMLLAHSRTHRKREREDLFNRLAKPDRWSHTSKRAVRLGRWAISDPRDAYLSVCVCVLVCLCMYDSVTKANVTLVHSHCNPLPSPDSHLAGRMVNSRRGVNNRHQSRLNTRRRKALHTSTPPSVYIPANSPLLAFLFLPLSTFPCLTLLQQLNNTEARFLFYTRFSSSFVSLIHLLTVKQPGLYQSTSSQPEMEPTRSPTYRLMHAGIK